MTVRLRLQVQRKVDQSLLVQFKKQASSVSNYLSHRPLPIQLHDGKYAAIFASQRWIPLPGFEMYDTRYVGTHRCLIVLHLCLVRKPRYRTEQAQALKAVCEAQDFRMLLPSIEKLCRTTTVNIHLSQQPPA